MLAEKIGVKNLTEPINEWVLYRNKVKLFFAQNATTFAFLAIFGWLSVLTLVVIYNG